MISADPEVREWMSLVARSFARSTGEKPELTSRAGAFAVTRDLKGATEPYPGRVVVFLERVQDAWLAAWSGADAWFVKPVNPFEVAETIAGFFAGDQKEAV